MKYFRLLIIATFLVFISLGQAQTKNPNLQVPTTPPGSLAILLGVDSVQKELKLTSLQRVVLNDIRNEYRDDCCKITAKVAAKQQTKQQGQASINDLTADSNRRALHALNDDQRVRLEEIRHQILGGYMLLSPNLQAQLTLNNIQKSKVAKIWGDSENYVSKINAQFEQGRISLYKRLFYLRKNRHKCSQEFLGILTPDQRIKLKKIAGQKSVN